MCVCGCVAVTCICRQSAGVVIIIRLLAQYRIIPYGTMVCSGNIGLLLLVPVTKCWHVLRHAHTCGDRTGSGRVWAPAAATTHAAAAPAGAAARTASRAGIWPGPQVSRSRLHGLASRSWVRSLLLLLLCACRRSLVILLILVGA